MMMNTICNFNWPISVEQTDDDTFTVRYGADEQSGLSWDQAAKKIGFSVMHSLASNSEITDNASL